MIQPLPADDGSVDGLLNLNPVDFGEKVAAGMKRIVRTTPRRLGPVGRDVDGGQGHIRRRPQPRLGRRRRRQQQWSRLLLPPDAPLQRVLVLARPPPRGPSNSRGRTLRPRTPRGPGRPGRFRPH